MKMLSSELYKDYNTWIEKILPAESCIGVDPLLFSRSKCNVNI